jgi:hypothetical protein
MADEPNTNRTDSDRTKVIGCITLVVLCPLAYALSAGPAWWLVAHGYTGEWVRTIYAPLKSLYDYCPLVRPLFDWYVGLWQ